MLGRKFQFPGNLSRFVNIPVTSYMHLKPTSNSICEPNCKRKTTARLFSLSYSIIPEKCNPMDYLVMLFSNEYFASILFDLPADFG